MRSLIGGILNRESLSFAPTKTGFGGLGGLLTSGISGASRTDQMSIMGGVGTLFAVVRRLCDSVSGTEWALFEKDSGNPFEVEPWSKRTLRMDHLAAKLWERPNPFMTQKEFVATIQQHYELTGEGWAFVSRNPRSPIPLELWPIAPDRIDVIPDAKKYIAGYVYTDPSGEKIPLNVDDVIRLRYPDPRDPYRGIGPVQTIMADLEGAKLTAEWNRNFFLNSARPGGIIELDRRMSDADFEKFRDRWNDQHRGSANAHRVAILTEAKWVESKFTQRDMQFTELRRATVDVICGAFGISKSKLGIVEDVNRANSDAQDVGYARDLIRPRLAEWRSALNAQLLPMYGRSSADLEFECPDPVVEDSESQVRILGLKATAASVLVNAGWKATDALTTTALPPMEYVGRADKVGGEAVIIKEDGSTETVVTAGLP